MSISDTLIGINSVALDTPLNHMIWLNDYKTYGANSYVFQNKDILHELYRDYRLTLNDSAVRKEAIQFADALGEAGLAISSAYDNMTSIAQYSTLEEVYASEDLRFLEELYIETGRLAWLYSEGVFASTNYTVSSIDKVIHNTTLSGDMPQDMVNKWYADSEIYQKITQGVDEAFVMYNFGGRVWAKCNNQVYLKAIYDYENSNGNIKTISGYTPSGDGTRNDFGPISNTKVMLRMFVEKGNCTESNYGCYLFATITNGESSITGSPINRNNILEFSEKNEGIMISPAPYRTNVYTFVPCDSVSGVTKNWASCSGVKASISAV